MADALLMEGSQFTKTPDKQPVTPAEAETAAELKVLLNQALEILRGSYDAQGTFSFKTFDVNREQLQSISASIGLYVEEGQDPALGTQYAIIKKIAHVYEMLQGLPFDDHASERIKQQNTLAALLHNTLTGNRMAASHLLNGYQDKNPFSLNQIMELEKKGLPLAVSMAVEQLEEIIAEL